MLLAVWYRHRPLCCTLITHCSKGLWLLTISKTEALHPKKATFTYDCLTIEHVLLMGARWRSMALVWIPTPVRSGLPNMISLLCLSSVLSEKSSGIFRSPCRCAEQHCDRRLSVAVTSPLVTSGACMLIFSFCAQFPVRNCNQLINCVLYNLHILLC